MSKTREVWLGMQAHEDEAKADCGCTLYRCDAESDDPFYVQCPLHAQAEAMRAYCERAVTHMSITGRHNSETRMADLAQEARTILRVVEGRETP